jgi:hypothetical protein
MLLKSLALITAISIAGFSTANAVEPGCRNYTPEQLVLLDMAHAYGKQFDYEYTLPAIIWQESFVGNMVIRTNPNDPSYGITHVTFPTLKWLSGKKHFAAAKEAENLVKDDMLALEYGVKKLKTVHRTTFWAAWRDYNGRSPEGEIYANKIKANIAELNRCKVF